MLLRGKPWANNPGAKRPLPFGVILAALLAGIVIGLVGASGVMRRDAWLAHQLRDLNLSGACNLALAIFAGIALLVGVRQAYISREVSALTAYESYHLACLQYPDLACGRVDWRRSGVQRREHYTTFVLFALMTGERVIKLFPRDKTWLHALKDDIRIHRDFISSDQFRIYRENQYWRICRLIEEVIRE